MSALIDLAVRAVVLLALAWVGTTLLRRRSASVRASIWTGALAAVLALPMVAVLVPAWRVPIWPAPSAPAVEVSAAVIPAPAMAPAVLLNDSTSIRLPAEAPAPPVISSSSTDRTETVLLALAAITLLLMARVAVSHLRMMRIAKQAQDAGAEWSTLVDRMRRDLQIARNVPVRKTDATNVPAVAGIWRPVLLLPIDTTDWPPDVRRAVVLHELAHVVRWDAVSQLLGQVACAVYWFVPLAWYGARRAATLRERASDDIVIQAGVRPSAYAGSLVALARSSAGDLESSATLAMAESRIHERVVAILNPAASRDRLTWRSAALVFALVCLATTAVGAIEPVERSRDDVMAAAPAPQSAGPRGVSAPVSPTKPAPPPENRTPRRAGAEIQAPAQAAAPAPAGYRFCSGKGLDHSSSSIQEDDGRRRWTIKLSGGGCSVDLRAEGTFEFNADFTDITRISNNGFFRVDVTDGGVRRQLDIESRGGTQTRTWRVDGRERPFDAEAKAWFAAFLVELDRRTAIGVDVRLPHLIRQGGVDAVLRETALMVSDYARSRYYLKLPAAASMTPAQTTSVLRQAASLTKSDHYASELIGAYVPSVKDAAVRAAMVDLVEKMSSDHYRATSIETIMGPGAPGPAEMDVLVRLVPRMSSDHYKTQVLTKVLKADSLTEPQRAAIAGASAAIESDHYATEVLKLLARKGIAEESVRRAFFDATAKVGSDHYRGEVLVALLAAPGLVQRDLLDAVSLARTISSDHYQAQALERIARHSGATDRVRTAVLDASAGLSRHYADQVRRAAGK